MRAIVRPRVEKLLQLAGAKQRLEKVQAVVDLSPLMMSETGSSESASVMLIPKTCGQTLVVRLARTVGAISVA
jgi:hypothetical protein